VGSVLGILSGWIATRIISFAFQRFLESKEIPPFDPFALPLWLIGLALVFGVSVSIAAGLYPAGRAARVDPVTALRSE
jgi:putative ABC transport system permease protein